MPKYVYDPRLNMMVPQQKRGINYALTGEGLRITDHDKKVEFVITRNNECRLPGRGMKFDCKLYDTYTARQIAGRVQRVYPQSKYKDWRFFAKGFRDPYDFDIEEQMTSEDKALLRSLTESYGTEDVMNFVNHLDEGHVASVWNAQSSHGQTPGTTQHGLKGFVNALPSLIVGFLVCPPAMILGWLGAVHERTEKRWLKTRINPNRWLDFVATPWEKQKKVKDKIAEEMAANTNYYYTRLANGEILRVVGCSTLEAKEMVMAIEHADIMKRYAQWNDYYKLTENKESAAIVPSDKRKYRMWVIKFNNGEACYAFGKPDASDKEEIMEAAIESRKAIVEYYKKIKYEDEDNGDKKVQKHGGIGKEKKIFGGDDDAEMQKLFSIPKIDDMIEITNIGAYKIINEQNFKDFTVPTTSQMTWQEEGKVMYKFEIGDEKEPFIEFKLPLTTNVEAQAICEYLCQGQRSFANKIAEVSKFFENNHDKIKYYSAISGNGDVLRLPVFNSDESHGSMTIENGYDIIPRNVPERANEIFESISEAIEESNVPTNIMKISPISKKDYATNYKKNNRQTRTSIAGVDEDGNGDMPNLYKDWTTKIRYTRLDATNGRVLEGPTMYSGSANVVKTNTNTNSTQSSNNNQGVPRTTQANITTETPDSSTQTNIGA